MASVWGPHRPHVLGVPVSGSCGSAGGWNLRAVGAGTIRKLPCALLGQRVTLRPLVVRRGNAGMVASWAYPTCSSGRWLAWFLFEGLCGRGYLCVPQNRLYASRTRDSGMMGNFPIFHVMNGNDE